MVWSLDLQEPPHVTAFPDHSTYPANTPRVSVRLRCGNMSLTPSPLSPYSYARHCTLPQRWETSVPKKRQGKKAKKVKEVEVLGFLGVGLDGDEGHRRITTGDNFLLVGGSEDTHEKMIDSAVHLNEELEKRGKRLEDASIDELVDLFRDVQAKRRLS